MSLADRMAIASPNISAVTVEATEFPELAREFGVQGVPRTVVNRGGAFAGALPEQQFVAAVLELAGVDGQPETETAVQSEETDGAATALEPTVETAAESAAKAEVEIEPGAEAPSDSAPGTERDRH